MAHLSAAAKVAPARKEQVHEPPDFQPSVAARTNLHESWKQNNANGPANPDIDVRATHNGTMTEAFRAARAERTQLRNARSESPMDGYRSQFAAGVSTRNSKRVGVPLQAVEQMKVLVEEAAERNQGKSNVCENPTLFHPNARWRFRWDMLMAVFILYSVAIIPLRIGFDVVVRDSSTAGVLDIIVDLFFLADMCVNFNTAYINESTEQLVETRTLIAKRYMGTWFTIDILSTLPIDRIVVWTGGGGSSNIRSLKLVRTLRLVRLLKLMRVFKLQKMATLLQDLNINPALLRLVQMLCVLIFVAHLLACFWSYLALPELAGGVEVERLRSWRQTSSLPDLQDGRRGTVGEEYLLAFYWVVASMMAVGYGDITAATDSERLYSIVTQVIGAACFGFIIATVTQVIETMSPRASTFKAKMNDIADYMAFRGLPKDLRRKINRHFEFYYSKSSVFNGPHAYFGEEKILAEMPQELRMHTVTYVHGDSLDKLTLFAGHDEPCFVAEMAARVQPMMAPTGYVIFKKNEVAEEMYFLTKGKVHMLVIDEDDSQGDADCEEFLEAFIKRMSPEGSTRHVEWSSESKDQCMNKRPKMPSSPLVSPLASDDEPSTPPPLSDCAPSGAGAADNLAGASNDLVRLASSHHDTDISQTTVCGVLTEGMHFGDQELLVPAPRRFTTMSCVFSELLTLSKGDLEEVLYLFPESAARMVKTSQEATAAFRDAVASATLKPYKVKERALVGHSSSKNLTPLLGQGRRLPGQRNSRKNLVAVQPRETPHNAVDDDSFGESEHEADFVFDWVPQRKARVVLNGKLQLERHVDREIFVRSSTLDSIGDGMSAGEGGVLSVREKKAVFQEKLASVTRPSIANSPASSHRILARSQTVPGQHAGKLKVAMSSPPALRGLDPGTPPVVITKVTPPVKNDTEKVVSSSDGMQDENDRPRKSFSDTARDFGHRLEDSVQRTSRKLSGSAQKAMSKLGSNKSSPDEIRRREQARKKAEVQKRKKDVEQLRRMDRMSSSMMSFDNEMLTSKSSVAYLNLQKGFCLVEETVQQVHSRFIIHPDDPWKLKWDMWIGLLIIYSVLFVPLRIGFFLEVDNAQAAIDWAMDGCFFVDICLSFRLAYRHPVDAEVVVTALSMIRRHYLRGWFTIDFISTVPFDHIAKALAGSGTNVRAIKLVRVVRLFRLLKLLRLFKLRALWRMVGEHLEISPLLFRMIKLFGQLVFIAHLFGCMWHYVSDANYDDTWVDGLLNRVGDNSTETGSGAILDDNLTSRYISAIYWAFTTMTTVGYGDITPQNFVERSYAVVIMILGGTVFGYIVGSIASLVGSPRQGSGRTEAASQGLNVYLEEQQLPAHIRTHAKKHFQYLWSRKVDAMGEANILSELPIVLRREVLIYSHREEISKIPIFTGGRDVAFIAYVVQRMRPAAFPKDQFIVSQGFSARAIHFIISGVVEKVISPKRAGTLVTEQETVKDVLTTGDFFGHEALLLSSRHEYGIRTFVPCFVYTLTKEEIGKMVDDSPVVALKLQQALHAAVARQAGRATKVRQLSVDPASNYEERQAVAHATVLRAAEGYHATHRSSKPLPLPGAEHGEKAASNSSRWRLANILSLSAHAHQYQQSLGAMRRLSTASGLEQSYVHNHTRLARMTPAADASGDAAPQEGAADKQ